MAVFGIETDFNIKIREFMEESNNRLNKEDFWKSPFEGVIKLLKTKDPKKDTYLVIMDPLYPPFYLVGVLWVGAVMVFNGLAWSWLMAPGCLLFAFSVFWNKHFIFFMLRIALLKKKIKGKVSMISNSRLIRSFAY